MMRFKFTCAGNYYTIITTTTTIVIIIILMHLIMKKFYYQLLLILSHAHKTLTFNLYNIYYSFANPT